MSIYQESSSIDTNTVNAAGLVTNLRAINTNVLVDDGQIIVLGGLIQDSVNDTNEQVPGLCDLPLIGNLFKYKTRGRTKTNLMIFLRPVVMRSEEQAAKVTADRYDYMRTEELNTQLKSAVLLPDYPAPVLPPVDHGQISGAGLVKIVPGAASGVPLATPTATPMVTPDAPVIDLTTKPKQ